MVFRPKWFHGVWAAMRKGSCDCCSTVSRVSADELPSSSVQASTGVLRSATTTVHQSSSFYCPRRSMIGDHCFRPCKLNFEVCTTLGAVCDHSKR